MSPDILKYKEYLKNRRVSEICTEHNPSTVHQEWLSSVLGGTAGAMQDIQSVISHLLVPTQSVSFTAKSRGLEQTSGPMQHTQGPHQLRAN